MATTSLFASNDPTKRILGPDGRPWADDAPAGIKLPHVWTFASLVNTVSKSYSQRWDEAYKESRENALAMRRDCGLMALLRERQYPTEQMNWHLEPEDKKDSRQIKDCAFLERIIRRTPAFHNYKRAALEALWYGRGGPQQALSYDQLDGQRITYVSKHLPVNGDKIQFDWDGTPKIRLYAGAAQAVEEAGGTVQPTDVGFVLKLDKPYWRTRFCIHKHDVVDADFLDDDAAGGIGGLGLRHWVYWLDWLKKEIMSWLMDYMERTGLGLTIYYYDASNPQGKAEAEKDARDNSRNTSIVWPRSAEGKDLGPGIERIETNVQGAQIILGMMKYFDDKIERFFIGQTLSSGTEGSGLGGTGVAKMHGNTKYRVIKSDCDNLAETFTEDLVTVLRRLNLPKCPYRYAWVFNVDEWDPDGKLSAINKAYSMGVSFVEDEVRSIVGLSKPNADDIVLKKQPEMPPGFDPGGSKAPGKPKALFPLVKPKKDGGRDAPVPKETPPDQPETYHRSPRLEFYEELRKPQKSFLSRVLDTLHVAEKRVEQAVKKVLGRALNRFKRSVKPPASEQGESKPEPRQATEEDVKDILTEVEKHIDPVEIQQEIKPALERLHTASSLLELDNNVRTRVGAYAGNEVFQERFSTLKKKLPEPLREAASKFLEETFQQPWWDDLPTSLAEELGGTLRKGVVEGDSIERLMSRLQNAWADLSTTRARLIARTETTGCLNAGLQAARLEQFKRGLVTHKRWQDLEEDVANVRPTHHEANGQTVGVLDDFTVGGESCPYPGHHSLSAKERCNCRCVGMSVPLEKPEQYARQGNEDGHWVTIGAKDGHGGNPVFIRGGRIEKGAPSLQGKTLPELKKHPTHEHWTGKAKEARVSARSLHHLAHQMHHHDKAFAEQKTRMLQEARKLSKDLGYDSLQGLVARGARGRLDADKLRGLDDVAERMAERYPEYLGDKDGAQERLFDMLLAGNPKAMSRDDAYAQALDHLQETKRAAKRNRSREPVPFQRMGLPAGL